ncbi:GNAT family N-acetyltransferase [Thiocystis violacea]|uniref:GNAT family N-acetyltransferase n=1 Tax=Thiocystis violacea TaxID=13725 RepID=UPI0019050BC2|nr:GNAT family N-acetyltransferase [Thiocystis violacea]MBK1717121.1 hypothetical protein [Thiocystis violacea]
MFDTLTAPVTSGHAIRLKDGTPCRLRPIGRDDREAMLACFAGLSPESRWQRFFGAKPALTESDLAFLTSADGHDHIALGAFRLNAWGEEIEVLGAARCIRLGPGSDTSELAMAVIDAARGRGLGKALVKQLVVLARREGLRRFRYEVLTANKDMRALAVSLGGRVHGLDDGTLTYDYDFAEPQAEPADSLPPWLDPFAITRLAIDAWSASLHRLLNAAHWMTWPMAGDGPSQPAIRAR